MTWPHRTAHSLAPLDFAALARLDFEAPREEVFPALRLAREAGTVCGTLPAVMNAANEVAVEAFLNEVIPFPKIWGLVEEVMGQHSVVQSPSLEALIEADNEARQMAQSSL